MGGAIVDEFCPRCETQVVLEKVFMIHECPSCMKPIKPCVMHDMDKVDCGKFPLDYIQIMDEVKIKIRGGVVQEVKKPDNVKVVVMGYDFEDHPEGVKTEW